MVIQVPVGYRYGPASAQEAIARPAAKAYVSPRSAADPTDPVIIAQATALNHDPAQIFAFVRDQIGIDPYPGSLRGAHGTLAGMAGNAIDRASLTIALLRASGFTARYAQGTLAYADAQKIIARAFADPQRIVGCNNTGGISDARNDGTLINEALAHFWVEYQATGSSSWTALDPAFADAAIGQTFTAETGNFTDVAENQQHKVRVRVTTETYSQAGALYGFGLSSSTMLDQTFDSVDLVDKPITVGHFVSRQAPAGLSFSAVINTYSPYVTVGDSATDVDDYQVVRGTDYSETFTNFPLGTVLITGVFVDIDVISPTNPGNPQTFRRVLVDRIGYAKRQSGGSVNAPQPTDPPALTALDLMTIQASPSLQPVDAFIARQTRLTALRAQLAPLVAQVNTLPDPAQQTPDQIALRTRANNLNRDTTIATLELMTSAYSGYADHSVSDIGATYLVKPWIISPRLTIAHANVDNAGFHLNLDIRKNDLRVYSLPGISYNNIAHFERARGMAESVLEGQVFTSVSGLPSRSIASVFQSSNPDLVSITRYNPTAVDQLNLSADAKARIRDTVAGGNGRSVVAPRAPVTVNGSPYSVWLETDPYTGITISTGDDGTHQAIGEYGGLLLNLFGVDSLETQMAKFIGQVDSIGVSGIAFTAAVIDAISSGNQFTDLATQIKQTLNSGTGPLQQVMDFLENSGASEYCTGGCGLIQNMLSGLLDGIKAFKDAIGAGDPPVPSIVMAPPLPPLPAPITPGSSAGFTMNIVRDTRYFVPYNGAEVPTVFLAKITNTGPATDTFRLNYAGVDAPFSMATGVSQITLAPGASGEVGVCLIPYAALPPNGTTTNFHLRITTPVSGVDQTIDGSQTTPNASALLMQIQPDNASAKAGDSIPATLTFNSLGNAATTANLTSILPPGLTVSGVPSNVNLAAGETRSIPITIGVGSGVASGSALTAQLNGEFGATAPARALFTANVTSTLTTCVANAAIKATDLGRTGLGATLVRLAGAMDMLATNPSSGDDRSSVLVELDDLIHTQFSLPFLSSYVSPVTAERATLAAAAASDINASLSAINTTLCGLVDTLQSSATDQIVLGLAPVQSIAVPTQTTTVRVNLYNATTLPRVFDVAISGVPPQVSAALTSTTVTLPAQSQTNGCCGLPPLTITFTNTDGQARAFDYVITATPHDNPALTQHVTGNFILNDDVIHVASVAASPVDADAGTPVQITVKLMNSLNARRQAFAFWYVRDETNTTRRSGQTDTVALAPGDGIVTLPPFNVDTTGFAGAYTIEIDVIDASACCNTLPGSSGFGSFLIGQPFSAVLSATPSNVPLGTSTVNYALALSHESAPTPVIDPRSSLAMATSTRSFVRNGNYLYVCESDRVAIVDTTNPDALTVAATFATDLLGITYINVSCNLDGNTFVLAYGLQSPSSFDNLKIVAYDIGGAHATAPVQLNTTPVQVAKRFGGNISFNGSHQGSLVTAAVIYNPFSGFIFEQNGNLISLDFSTPTAPLQMGELYHHFDSTDTNDPIYGGPNVINAGLPRGSYTLLATTTAVGDGYGTGPGVGRIATVDTTQLPTNCPGAPNPCIVHATDISQATVLFGIAAQGNAGLAVGDTIGSYDGYSGYIGQLTLSALDLTSATNPIVQSSMTTLMLDRRPAGAPCNLPGNTGGTSLNALTNNYYAVGAFNPLSCSWVLAIVDANDTTHLRIIPYDVTSQLRQTILEGDKLYAMTDTDILVYDYATIAGPAITATVDIPKGTGVTIATNSFSVAPTNIDTSATDHDSYFWYRPTATNITWQGQVTNMKPGEIRTVANGGAVTYTLPSIGSGSMALNEVNVSTGQTMAISPAIQNAALGDPATYTITITNPTAASVNYALSVSGVAPNWVTHLDTPVSVPANGQATSTLILQTTQSDPQYTFFPFTVNGAASSGFTTSASAVLNTQNQNIGSDQAPAVYASSLTPLNATITAGRGSVATNTLHVNNLGSGLQQYGMSFAGSGGDFGSQYLPGGFTLNAGASTDVLVTVTVRADTAPGTYPLTTQLGSYGPYVYAAFNVVVPNQGVQLSMSPSSGTPTTTFSAIVRNTGVAADTFDLSGLGPLGPAVVIAPSSVTLDPSTNATVTVTLGNAGFVPQGTSSFDIQAISRSQSAARARATAQVVSDARKSIALAGEPPSISVADVPATRSFGVAVQNAGNVEDAYTLAIIATSANLSASLRDDSGGATQSVAPIRLPGNALALAHVDATINSGTSGTVMLKATSQSDSSVTATTVLSIVKNGSPNIVLGTPGSLEFGDQALTTMSDVHSIVLTNTGLGTFTIGSIALSGANTNDFALAPGTNACIVGGTIAAGGGQCTLYVTFTPLAIGSRSATVSVSDIGAVTTIPVSLHGNGVDVSGHLTAEILPNRNYVQFGHAINYLVSARNPSSTATSGVSISTTLPPGLDAASATWLCINAADANSICTPNGTGPLSDTNMRVPANGSVSYLMTVLAKPQTPTENVVSGAAVSSVADPGPYSATSTPTQIVVYRDGFQPYGDGASSNQSSVNLSSTFSIDSRNDLLLDLAAMPATDLIDTLLVARAPDSTGFRIERLNFGDHAWLRAIVFDAAGTEQYGSWIAAPVAGTATIALVDNGGATTLLLQVDAGDSTSLTLKGAAGQNYSLLSADFLSVLTP